MPTYDFNVGGTAKPKKTHCLLDLLNTAEIKVNTINGSKVPTLTETSLYQEQRAAIDFLKANNETLLLADVGTGKTVVMLTVLQHWLKTGAVQRAVIVAPKRVCQHVWIQEISQWGHINPKVLKPVCLAGMSADNRKRCVKNTNYKTLIINYESLPWLMTQFPEGIPNGGDKCIIFDEVDKMKSHTSLRWKGKAKYLTEAGEQRKLDAGEHVEYAIRENPERILIRPGASFWVKGFKYRIGATGTPMPNCYSELWAQTYLIDRGKALGEDYNDFLYYNFYKGRRGRPVPYNPRRIRDKIEHLTASMQYAPDMPKQIDAPIRWVDMDKDTQQVYERFEFTALIELEDVEVSAVSKAALWQKLRQLSSGFAYGLKRDLLSAIMGGGNYDNKQGAWLDKVKHKELDSLISELQGAQLLIVYDYAEQAAELARKYPDMMFLDGRTRDRQAAIAIQKWNSGELQLLGIHPKSAGHGLNLQKSHCKHIVFITLPMSAGEYDQTIGRIARRGGAKHVTIHKILTNGTQDIEDLARVQGKITTQDEFTAAMRRRVQQRENRRRLK